MDPRPSRLAAILRQRCPSCRRGRVFAGALSMHERCPECGVRFEREPGYFFGAMYVSYALCVLIVGGLAAVLALTVLRSWNPRWIVFPAGAIYLLLVPAVFRYSRIVWMHFDRFFHPDEVDEVHDSDEAKGPDPAGGPD